MGFFGKLFGKKQNEQATSSAAASLKTLAGDRLNDLAKEKERDTPLTQEELLKTFAEYFAPNTGFFSAPGSPQSNAYFSVVNAARDEMVRNKELFERATKWKHEDLVRMLKNPQPAITNMMVCGLIFAMGDYAVIKATCYCVDFCDIIPNCAALYLLLISQKLDADKRKLIIDAGDRSKKVAFRQVMQTLKVCDPTWEYLIV